MPKLFVPNESNANEPRVAASPEMVKRYVKLGFSVLVESGAGLASASADASYREAGAEITTDLAAAYGEADIILKVGPPRTRDELGKNEASAMRAGAIFVGFLQSHLHPEPVAALAEAKVTCFAMEHVPRITRAQKMDALSSQANIAGYKAVVLGANHCPRLFPLLMTAAGTITPARVVILGAGVAGLQAIATAKRLGAVVEVSDVRPAVKEQVESLGGRFIDVPLDEGAEDAGGYAKEQSAEFLKRQQAIVREHIVAADVVITTAQIPGKPSPMLIPADMVEDMKQGAVIVDLAVEGGGNCALSQPDEVVEHDGVTILGYRNVAGMVPFHASDVYAKNVMAVVQHLYSKEGELVLDFEDEITDGSIVIHEGEIRNARVAEAVASTAS